LPDGIQMRLQGVQGAGQAVVVALRRLQPQHVREHRFRHPRLHMHQRLGRGQPIEDQHQSYASGIQILGAGPRRVAVVIDDRAPPPPRRLQPSLPRSYHRAKSRLSGVDKHSVESEIPIRLCNYTHVYKYDSITPELDFMPATATEAEIAAFSLRRGDVLITKDS